MSTSSPDLTVRSFSFTERGLDLLDGLPTPDLPRPTTSITRTAS